MDENQEQHIDVEQTNDQTQDIPLNTTETEPKKKTIPTRVGSLILLLVATIAGAGVWWYSFSYEEPVPIDIGQVVRELQMRREIVAGEEMRVISGYETKEDGVYYRGKLVEVADLETFEFVGWFNYVGIYAKDKTYVYHDGSIVKKADPKTFEYVGAMYTKDVNNVFMLDETDIDAPPPSFLPEFSNDIIIPNADPKSFSWVKDAFAKDIENVYYAGKVILNADPSTFEQIKYLYAKDATYIYFAGQLIPDAILQSFEYIDKGCAKDEVSVYCDGKKIVNADPNTFQSIGDEYTKDKEHVYYYGKIVENADPETFQLIEHIFTKDIKHVYYVLVGDTVEVKIVPEADPETFEFVGNSYAKDLKHVYEVFCTARYLGGNYPEEIKIVNGVNPANCTVENLDGCKGVE